MDVDDAIAGRRSVRGFLNTPVSRETVAEILALAARAPTSTNTQPWHVFASSGAARDGLCEAVSAAHARGDGVHRVERALYPDPLPEPYRSRRRELALALYATVGVEPGDRAAGGRQFAQNYTLFGAPVGLFVFIDKALLAGSWLDLGMFLQTAMLAARARGLATCPQACWAPYHAIIRERLGVPDDLSFACALALGHEDESAPANRLRTARAPVAEFARFAGFG